MDLTKIVSISGKPGLYVIKSQAIGRIIVESVAEGKCVPAFARDRMSSLEEISIFSTDEDRPLKEVFKMIHDKMGDKVDFDFKKASNDELREKFAFVMPDYDEDAVYPSDMKKVFQWYQMLNDKGLKRQSLKPKKTKSDFISLFLKKLLRQLFLYICGA